MVVVVGVGCRTAGEGCAGLELGEGCTSSGLELERGIVGLVLGIGELEPGIEVGELGRGIGAEELVPGIGVGELERGIGVGELVPGIAGPGESIALELGVVRRTEQVVRRTERVVRKTETVRMILLETNHRRRHRCCVHRRRCCGRRRHRLRTQFRR